MAGNMAEHTSRSVIGPDAKGHMWGDLPAPATWGNPDTGNRFAHGCQKMRRELWNKVAAPGCMNGIVDTVEGTPLR